VEYSKTRKNYIVKGYETESCGNLYAFVMEKINIILKPNGRSSVIIPLAAFSTERMDNLQHIYRKCSSNMWISNFEATSNPTILFIGVKIQLSILIVKKIKNQDNGNNIFSTSYKRCYSAERDLLFDKLYYSNAKIINNYIVRVNDKIEIGILGKLFIGQTVDLMIGGKFSLFYRNMGNFFYKLAFMKEPKYYKNNEKVSSSTVSQLLLNSTESRDVLVGLINSSLFYYYWILFSDCYHLSKSNITEFHFEMPKDKKLIQNILTLTEKYISAIEKEASWQIENKKDGTVKKYRRYFPQKCKHISDEIDKLLAKHYGFTDEELDYIINYDIKYRMGNELEEYEE